MANQTFKLMNSNKEIGYISKTEDNNLVMSLKGFWGKITSKKMKVANVDDFVGSIFWGDELGSAVVDCTSDTCENLTVFFDGRRYAGCVEVTVIANEIGRVYDVNVTGTEDVTGTVILS